MNIKRICRTSNGFTLIELLVVISIIAVLLSVLIPALNIAKQKASRIVCMANQRNIALAWEAYTTENNGRIVNGYCSERYMQSYQNPQPGEGGGCWVEPPQDEDGNYRGGAGDNVPLEYRLNGLRKGLLYSYLEETDVYHCSGDHRVKKGTKRGNTLADKIYRSYSIPDGIHANAKEDEKTYKVPTLVTRSAIRMSQVRHPAIRYILIEESYDGGPTAGGTNFNDSSWDLDIQNEQFWDPLGIYHSDSCTIAYADTHVESYKFRDSKTVKYFADRDNNKNPGGEDLRYFLKNWPGIPR